MRTAILTTLLLTLSLAATPAQAGCDDDGDGHDSIICGGDDCDDSDANRFPGNVEVCDSASLDEDCNLSTTGDRDTDGDGFFDDSCCNIDLDGSSICNGRDCNDARGDVNPATTEVCNGRDDNCDSAVDEGLTRTFWLDSDGDGFGSTTSAELCPQDTEGHAARSGDCDDSSEWIIPGTQVCTSASAVSVCQSDGTWVADTCDSRQTCTDQPNESGICVFSPGPPPSKK